MGNNSQFISLARRPSSSSNSRLRTQNECIDETRNLTLQRSGFSGGGIGKTLLHVCSCRKLIKNRFPAWHGIRPIHWPSARYEVHSWTSRLPHHHGDWVWYLSCNGSVQFGPGWWVANGLWFRRKKKKKNLWSDFYLIGIVFFTGFKFEVNLSLVFEFLGLKTK